MKRLIVTADDLGLCRGLDRGIAEAAEVGIVTRVSIAAVGESFETALENALRLERPVGLHLVLTEERPVSPACEVPTLVGRDGRFHRTYGELTWRWAMGRVAPAEIERELRAQLARAATAGLSVSHLDTHCHVGVLPPVFDAVAAISRERAIARLRLPLRPLSLDRVNQGRVARAALLAGVGAWSRVLARRLPPGVGCAERVAGLRHSGALDERRLTALLRRLPEGTTELVCHPGVADAEARGRYGHWRYDWDGERRALCSREVRRVIDGEGIVLT